MCPNTKALTVSQITKRFTANKINKNPKEPISRKNKLEVTEKNTSENEPR